jgi:hypothetical protein
MRHCHALQEMVKYREMKISLQPSVLRWARLRALLTVEALAAKFGKKEAEKWEAKIAHWEDAGDLTYSEAEKLAHHTNNGFRLPLLRRTAGREAADPGFPDGRKPGGRNDEHGNARRALPTSAAAGMVP